MDGQYDNTNSAVAYNPRDNETLLSTGKVNNNGNEERIVILKSALPDGRVIRDVYEKVGTLFQNDKAGENMPLFSGPFKERRIAVWLKQNDQYGPFLSGKIEDKYDPNAVQSDIPAEPTEQKKVLVDDDIPF